MGRATTWQTKQFTLCLDRILSEQDDLALLRAGPGLYLAPPLGTTDPVYRDQWYRIPTMFKSGMLAVIRTLFAIATIYSSVLRHSTR